MFPKADYMHSGKETFLPSKVITEQDEVVALEKDESHPCRGACGGGGVRLSPWGHSDFR